MKLLTLPASLFTLALGLSGARATAQIAYSFSTGVVDGRMATLSQPSSSGKTEVESADDFLLPQDTKLTSATFTGLLPAFASIVSVDIEIYRVFPLDSTVPPSPDVPTRVNSPSDVEFASRSSLDGTLSFSTTLLSPSLSVLNSVSTGINPIPNQHTGGNGPVSGQEVQFNVAFTMPLSLAANHYFFVPQVQLASGEFFWLSATQPIIDPPPSFSPDLQMWIRNEALAPDWLRVGTDIVGGSPAPTFNAAFSLSGTISDSTTSPVPEPSTYGAIGAAGLIGLVLIKRKKRLG